MNNCKCNHSNKEWLKTKYIVEQLTFRDISAICGHSPTSIHLWAKKFNLKRRPEGFQRGLKNKCVNWKGGITLCRGYRMILIDRYNCKDGRKRPRYAFEHRLIASKILRRKLKHSEVIHHINHIISDNRPENLYLFKNNAEHKRYEHLKNQPPLKSNLSMND